MTPGGGASSLWGAPSPNQNIFENMCFSDNYVLLYICLYSRALCWEILGFIPALMLGSAKIATVAYSSLFCLYSGHTKKQQLLILLYTALFRIF